MVQVVHECGWWKGIRERRRKVIGTSSSSIVRLIDIVASGTGSLACLVDPNYCASVLWIQGRREAGAESELISAAACDVELVRVELGLLVTVGLESVRIGSGKFGRKRQLDLLVNAAIDDAE